MPGLLPGRPGNLTAEQEVKLREFWSELIAYCGVKVADDGSVEHGSVDDGTIEEDDEEDDAPAETQANGEKPKKVKKKRRLFGRKKKDKQAESDDKHGQYKDVQALLATTSPEELRRGIWGMIKMDNPDALMLRYLRARKWDVEKALVMLLSTIHWRSEFKVDEIINASGESVGLKPAADQNQDEKDFLKMYRAGNAFIRGVDKEGRPIVVVRARLHKAGEETMTSNEWYIVSLIEYTRMTLVEPVDAAAVVFDMTGFTMANMDNGPVKFMIKCMEANYPESLGVVLVHKAPWIFQGIWKIVRGWLDPVVASKVHFTNTTEDLQQFIETSNIPHELDAAGGDDWKYQYVEPRQGENKRMEDSASREKFTQERMKLASQYETATIKWLGTSAGSEEDKKAKADRVGLVPQLKKAYWNLDPYIRARSVFDRWAMLQEGGRIQVHPESEVD